MKTYTLKWSEWTSSSYGQPAAIEDFVPYGKRALISCGSGLRNLTMVVSAEWEVVGDAVLLSAPVVERTGEWLRLGHMKNDGEIVHSEGWEGPHQPFVYRGKRYYTNGLESGIWCDEEEFLTPWKGYIEVGNPWIDRGVMFFEALPEGCSAPDGWQIWKLQLAGGEPEYVCQGANPCIYKSVLYRSIWKKGHFELAIGH